MRIEACPCVLALLVAGCLSYGEGHDAKVPGEELGTYEVVARLVESSCGPGALGASEVWEFPIRLSRDTDEIFWLNGKEVISGRIAADGTSFSFDTRVSVEVLPPEGRQPGCTVMRTDRASGALAATGADVPSFTGTLAYDFTAAAGSDCAELAAMPDGLAALPCSMSYTMTATRIAAASD